jgi:hypothetical protein
MSQHTLCNVVIRVELQGAHRDSGCQSKSEWSELSRCNKTASNPTHAGHRRLVFQTTALDSLYNALSSEDDPVARLAAAELVGQHVTTSAGVHMLEQSGALSSLGAALADIGSLDGQILAPGVLALFGTLACVPGVDREGLLTAHGALQCIERAVRDPRSAGQVCPAALDAAAAIASKRGGLALLIAKLPPTFLPALRALVRGDEGTEHSQAAMHAMARLVDQGDSDEEARDEDDASAAKQVFDSVANGAPDALVASVMRKAKLPFGDESAAAYHLLQSLASHEWGASALLHHARCVQWCTHLFSHARAFFLFFCFFLSF